MKHILPIITITTLAAAASAQSAASSGLSYNSVSATYSRTSITGGPSGITSYSVSAQALIGSSNVLVSGSTTVGGDFGTQDDSASLGYVFKNVQGLADVTVSVSSNDTFGVNVRKAIGSGFEVAASYSRDNDAEDIYGLAVGYTFNKVYSLDLGWSHRNQGNNSANTLSAGLRYNF